MREIACFRNVLFRKLTLFAHDEALRPIWRMATQTAAEQHPFIFRRIKFGSKPLYATSTMSYHVSDSSLLRYILIRRRHTEHVTFDIHRVGRHAESSHLPVSLVAGEGGGLRVGILRIRSLELLIRRRSPILKLKTKKQNMQQVL